MRSQWTFGMPPGAVERESLEARVRTALSTIGCRDVKGELTYGQLMDDLVGGRVDAAWAPPLLCARMEQAGARVVMRAVRGGSATYRGVLFARADRGLDVGALRGTRAGWMDERSMSGFVLPRAMLRARGVEPETTFARESFLGSYPAVVRAVLDGKVDVGSTFATGERAPVQRLGFADLAGDRAGELVALAYSAECPHDGIVLSPRMMPDEAAQFADAFERLVRDAAPAKALFGALQVEGFEAPVRGEYARTVGPLAREASAA